MTTLAFRSDAEVEALRSYLLKGGFLWVDDFWGSIAWGAWASQLARVLPPSEFPIQDVPLDHPIFRAGLRQVIEAADPGVRIVGEAKTGDEALAMIESVGADVAVLDIDMPGRDGLDVARTVRDRRSTTRVIVLTLHTDARFLNAALDAGVHGYVPKESAVTEIGGGSSLRIAFIVSTDESPRKGRTPVIISWRTAPNAKMSERGSAAFPRTCSGDM